MSAVSEVSWCLLMYSKHLQVEWRGLQFVKTLIEGFGHVLDALGDFVGDEKLLSGDPGFLDCDTDLLLGTIHFCTVRWQKPF